MWDKNTTTHLDKKLTLLNLEERLTLICKTFDRPIFTTSLGLEDQTLTFGFSKLSLHDREKIYFATLETGRLFPETLALINETNARYGIDIKRYKPNAASLENYIRLYGVNGFYESIESRKACCFVRKLEPLKLAVQGRDAWITGLRREQSDSRQDVPFAAWDEERKLVKLNPLADFTTQDVQDLIDKNNVAVNPLHARGYPSIGCEPCTRAIKSGEPERAGRWWWESNSKQECGLHVSQAETIQEQVDA